MNKRIKSKVKQCALICAMVCWMTHLVVADVFPAKEGFDAYGGYLNIKGTATGRFHLEEIKGRHFLITPEGHGFISLGVVHVGDIGRVKGQCCDYLQEKFEGDWEKASAEVLANFREWGYNCLGYDSHKSIRKRLPHFANGHPSGKVSLWQGKAVVFPDVFSEQWKAEARKSITSMAHQFPETANLIGIYWQDMPAWELKESKRKVGKTWVDAIRELPVSAPGKMRYEQFLRENGEAASDDDFLVLIAREVYSTIGPLTRELSPNTLIFGERYAGRALPWRVIQEALPYIDVVAVQPNSSRFSDVPFERLYKETGKPIIICDHNIAFGTPEYPNVMWETLPDAARVVRAYDTYLSEGFSMPFLIGYNKCQYIDRFKNPPGVLKQGLVQVDGTPYEELVKGVGKVNWDLHRQFIRSAE